MFFIHYGPINCPQDASPPEELCVHFVHNGPINCLPVTFCLVAERRDVEGG